jgi:hypothetical protein
MTFSENESIFVNGRRALYLKPMGDNGYHWVQYPDGEKEYVPFGDIDTKSDNFKVIYDILNSGDSRAAA